MPVGTHACNVDALDQLYTYGANVARRVAATVASCPYSLSVPSSNESPPQTDSTRLLSRVNLSTLRGFWLLECGYGTISQEIVDGCRPDACPKSPRSVPVAQPLAYGVLLVGNDLYRHTHEVLRRNLQTGVAVTISSSLAADGGRGALSMLGARLCDDVRPRHL